MGQWQVMEDSSKSERGLETDTPFAMHFSQQIAIEYLYGNRALFWEMGMKKTE